MTTSTDNDQDLPSSNEESKKEVKKEIKKKKGPIRFEALIPLSLICLVIFLYCKYALDSNLRSLTIWSLEQANGAEVNLSSVELSFLSGSLKLKGLEITDKDEPSKNFLAIASTNFGLNTYELLKAKFIVEKSSITGISWGVPRKKPGKVFKVSERKSEQLEKLEQSTIKTAQEQFKDNALGNVANILGGTKERDEIKALKAELITEQKIKELEVLFKSKEDSYKRRLDEFKNQTALKEVKNEVKGYKWDKRDPIKSLSSLNKLISKTKKTYKQYSSDIRAMKNDIKTLKGVSSEVDDWIKQDMKHLQSKVGIPKLDPEALAFSMFGNYFGVNVAKYRRYSEIAKEYLPPPKDQRGAKSHLTPRKRGEGRIINFPKVGENPKYWIKKIDISSQAGKSEYGGNLEGFITNITSAPNIINKPVEIKVAGAFPKQKVFGMALGATLDHRKEIAEQKLNLTIEEFPFKSKTLSKSKNLKLKLKSAPAKVAIDASLRDKIANITLNTSVQKPQFDLKADKKIVQESLSNILGGMNLLTLRAKAAGKWNSLKWNMRSNLGSEISNGLKAEIGNRIKAAKLKLRKKIESKIGPKKEKLNSLVNNFRSSIDSKLDKEKGRAGEELNKVIADLKKKQGKGLENKVKKIFKSKGAKKFLKKIF